MQTLIVPLPGFPCQTIDDATPEGAAQIARYVAQGGVVVPSSPALSSVLEKLGRVVGVGVGSGPASLLSVALAAQQAALGGGSAITWGTGGDAESFDDVMVRVEAAKVPLSIFQIPGTHVIPANSSRYEMNGSIFTKVSPTSDPGAIAIEDGAVLGNLIGGLANGVRVEAACSTPCFELDDPDGGAPRFMFLGPFGGTLINNGSAPMFDFPAGSFTIFGCIVGGGFFGNTAPVFALGAGATCIHAAIGSGPTYVGDWASGDGSTVLAVYHSGIALDNGPGSFLPLPASFLGSAQNAAIGTDGGSGPTAYRPVGLFAPTPIGCKYWDMTVGKFIAWDGAVYQIIGP